VGLFISSLAATDRVEERCLSKAELKHNSNYEQSANETKQANNLTKLIARQDLLFTQ
jgi:hypothetical protein